MNRQDELLPDSDTPRSPSLLDDNPEAVRQAGIEALAAMLDMTVAEIEAEPERWEAML